MSMTEAAYLAGIVDGEGSLTVFFRKPRVESREANEQLSVQFVVSMTHEPTIRYIADITETQDRVYFVKSRSEKHKHQFAWRPRLSDSKEILRQIEPYMITKKRNAQIFLELLDIRSKSTRSNRNWERQCELVIENLSLNKRGPI